MKPDWFSRGRDACSAGKFCFFNEGRVSSAIRQRWYAGWHFQNNLNANPASAEERKEAINGLQSIRDQLSKL